MSSYYSQGLQYKPHEQNYLQHTINSRNNSTRSNTRSNDNNVIDPLKNSEEDDVKYAPSISKKMTTTTYYVQKSGVSGIVANSSINTYGASTASGYNKIDSKVNSHLLDHGYGATPQPSYSNSNSSDDSGFKSYTKAMDGGITSYYKVSISGFLF